MEAPVARVQLQSVATAEMVDRAGLQRAAREGQEVRVEMARMGDAVQRMAVRAVQEATQLLALAVPAATVAAAGLPGATVARDSPEDRQFRGRVGKVVTLDLASQVKLLLLKVLTAHRAVPHRGPEARTAPTAAFPVWSS